MNSVSPKELTVLREGGKRLASVMAQVADSVVPGVRTEELNDLTLKLIKELGDTPAFLNYQPHGANRPYPAAVCVSIDDEVVHGIPNENLYTFKGGEIVTLDIGLIHDGLVTDTAHTVAVGDVDDAAKRLVAAAEEVRTVAIDVARAGATTGDIGYAVETFAHERGYSVPEELGGHGVGKSVHEEPFIPNVGKPGSGVPLVAGMVLAIEPILLEKGSAVVLDGDGYTYKTHDGARAAQFEHTILVGEGAPEVITRL